MTTISAMPPLIDMGAPDPMQNGPQGGLVHRFEELMRRTEGLDASPAIESSSLVETIRSQDTAMREDQQRLAKLQATINDESLPADQKNAQRNQMLVEIAASQLRFNASIYVAQSSKTGLQTLMKNQ